MNKINKDTFWKNVRTIFKNDLHHLFHNWVALIIVAAIAVLPALYAWFNIAAMWDPYANTKGLKVAVVNNDRGSTLMDIELDLGSQIIENLKSNDALGWQFMDTEEDAMDAVTKGSVYAALIIPQDFSEKMTTVLDPSPVYPTIKYYENQKLNPVAPKITEKGASTIQETVNKEFIGEVTGVVFQALNTAGDYINKNYSDLIFYKSLISKLNEKFPDIRNDVDRLVQTGYRGVDQLEKIQNNIPVIQDILNTSMDFSNDLETDYADLQARLSDSVEIVDSNLALVESILSSLNTISNDLYHNTKSNSIEGLDSVLSGIESGRKDLTELQNFLNDVSKDAGDMSELSKNSAAELIKQLDILSDTLTHLKQGNYHISDVSGLLSNINGAVRMLQRELRTLETTLDDDISPVLNQGIDAVDSLIHKLQHTNNDTQALINTAISNLDSNKAVLSRLLTTVNKLPGSKLLARQIQKAITAIDKIEAFLNSVKGNINSENVNSITSRLNTLLVDCKLALNGISDGLNSGLISDLDDILSDVRTINTRLTNLLSYTEDGAEDALDSSIKNTTLVKSIIEKYLEIVNKLDDSNVTDKTTERVQDLVNQLDTYSQKLHEAKSNIENETNYQSLINDLNTLNANMEQSITTIRSDYQSVTKPRIDNFLNKAIIINQDIGVLLKDTHDGLNEFHDIIQNIQTTGSKGIDALDQFNKEKMSKLQETVKTLDDVFNYIDSNVDINKILAVLSNDPDVEKEFLSEAVKLDTIPMFPVPNYGSALAPFFTILCLWVGATLLAAMLSVETKAEGCFTPKQIYIGKFLFFGAIAALQGFIVCIGDFLILKIHVSDPFVFTVTAMLSAVTFTMIIYTLVSLLDNVGKAISIVLLVLQIAAAGGTFPIQVTPDFFQKINPFMPFTYAIGAMREATGGIVAEILTKDILMILLYFIIFFMLGFFLKAPINSILRGFKQKWHEAELGE